MSSSGFDSKTVNNTPSLNSASISVTNISTQNLVGTNLTLSSVAVSGDVTVAGNYKNSKWTISQNDISGNGNIYGKNAFIQGNLAINKPSPSYSLDVSGIINGSALYVNGSPYIGSQFITSGSNIYFTGGNIGVGKTTPSYTVDVSGILNTSTLYINGLPLSGSQWTTSGANLYYTGGNVSIGKSTNAYSLDISGALNVGPINQPTLSNVSAYFSGTCNFASGAYTNLAFDSVESGFNNIGYTPGSLSGPTCGTFTSSKAGFYSVSIYFMLYIGGQVPVSYLQINKNTVSYKNVYPGTVAGNWNMYVSTNVIYLGVGEFLTFTLYWAGSAAANSYYASSAHDSTNLNIYYLRAT